MSTLPPNVFVLFTALSLAHAQEATEIGVDHLLAALEAGPSNGPDLSAEGTFVPAPRVELPLSAGVRSVISSLGDIESASVDTLRGALLRAKADGIR